MPTPNVSLGYIILCVEDVAASVAFYEAAFGLSRRFFHEDGANAYGELETGATRLAFASLQLAKTNLNQNIIAASPDKPPLGVEVALVTEDVHALFDRAVKAGATPLVKPAVKPWGQTVAYVRDNSSHLVEICTPVG